MLGSANQKIDILYTKYYHVLRSNQENTNGSKFRAVMAANFVHSL